MGKRCPEPPGISVESGPSEAAPLRRQPRRTLSNEEIALRAEGLYKVFGRRGGEAVERLRAGQRRDELGGGTTAAVIDASFEVKRGEIFVVMGLSGSGKSTLIRMLNGLFETTAGTIFIGDDELASASTGELRKIRRERVSMVFQHFALFPHRTVAFNVAYPLKLQGVDKATREAKADEILSLVGLDGWGDKFPHQLSGGMKQRVGIARALAADTEILLMDEAFSALDPLIRREMQDQLIELQETLGKTIIFITHDLNEAMLLGDRIAVMRDGEIVQIGTPEDILTDPANDYVEQFVQDVDRARVLTAGNVMEKPRAVVSLTSGPRTALRTMRDTNSGAAYVVDRDRKLLGTVDDRSAVKLIRKGERSLEGVIKNDAVSVNEDSVLMDLFVPSVESKLAVAVLNEAGKLIGVIPRVTLLAALGPGPGATEEITLPQQPVPSAEIDEILAATDEMGA